jgi:hypothetical protein
MSWDFRNLNLANYDIQKGGQLPEGPHICKITNAEMNEASGGQVGQLVVELESLKGEGMVKDYITLFSKKTDENSQKAVEIGRGRLKSILHFSGFPNADAPSDVKNLKGIVVGVYIEKGEDFVKDGVTKKGFNRPRRRGQAYFDPADLGVAKADFSKVKAGSLNDDIPF